MVLFTPAKRPSNRAKKRTERVDNALARSIRRNASSQHITSSRMLVGILTKAALLAAIFSLIGHVQSALGAILLARFRKRCRIADEKLLEYSSSENKPREQSVWPAVSILKPLHGQEPLLEDALESFFGLDYPDYELVFGVHHADDAALDCVRKLATHYPEQKISVVADSTTHGTNRKITNLINMQRACQHDILVISDSDIHVEKTYLKHIVSTLRRPKTDLVTTLYAGLPGDNRLVRLFAASNINANFLPGVMMSHLIGRQDCLGATMALTRQKLLEIGGFEALVDHVADDNVLGQLIAKQGGQISLAPTLCLTTVSEDNFRSLIAHELRWGRTTRSIEPVGYGFSVLQLPLFWASLSVILAPMSFARWTLLIAGWAFKGSIVSWIARLTNCPLPGIFPLLIVRDWLSVLIMMGSARGSRVVWRGRTVHITSYKTTASTPSAPPSSTEHPMLSSFEFLSTNRSVQS